MNLFMKQNQNHRDREQISACQGGGGWRTDTVGGWG